jgi:TetR/AcrR family transcriptional repressor of nem operon
MDLAQAHIQKAGYSGFSFRDLAVGVGIKNPSVHHHFPTKAAMAAAIGRRYVERFFESVSPKPGETPEEVISAYQKVFRDGIESGQMCLFGMLGAESPGLPTEVTDEVGTFFRKCVDDLERRIGGPDARKRAMRIMAMFEGAQILVRAYGDIAAFDEATADLVATLPSRRKSP